jgi:hypothetical protein
MSIVWVVPMLAPSYGESRPAGEPDLIRQPGVASSAAGIRSAAPAGRCAVRAHARARIPSCFPRSRPMAPRCTRSTRPKQSAGPAPSAPHACPWACRPARTASGGNHPEERRALRRKKGPARNQGLWVQWEGIYRRVP